MSDKLSAASKEALNAWKALGEEDNRIAAINGNPKIEEQARRDQKFGADHEELHFK